MNKLSHRVWEGGKVATGGCTGEVITNPILCCLYWNRVQMLDDLMIRGAVMISLGDVFVQGWTYNCFLPYAP